MLLRLVFDSTGAWSKSFENPAQKQAMRMNKDCKSLYGKRLLLFKVAGNVAKVLALELFHESLHGFGEMRTLRTLTMFGLHGTCAIAQRTLSDTFMCFAWHRNSLKWISPAQTKKKMTSTWRMMTEGISQVSTIATTQPKSQVDDMVAPVSLVLYMARSRGSRSSGTMEKVRSFNKAQSKSELTSSKWH
eukprot:2424914-Amphidinium_carterae.1